MLNKITKTCANSHGTYAYCRAAAGPVQTTDGHDICPGSGDISNFVTADADECNIACYKNQECTAYVLTRGRCFLKNCLGPVVASQDSVLSEVTRLDLDDDACKLNQAKYDAFPPPLPCGGERVTKYTVETANDKAGPWVMQKSAVTGTDHFPGNAVAQFGVVSQSECWDAAIAAHGNKVTSRGKMFVTSHKYDRGVPTGCSVQSSGDWAVHFNKAEGSGNDGGYTVVTGQMLSGDSEHKKMELLSKSVDARYVRITPVESEGGKKKLFRHMGSGGECSHNEDAGVVAQFGVVSESECWNAAIAEHGNKVTSRGKMFVTSHKYDCGVPTGCSVQSGGDWAVHFNKAEGSCNDGGYTVVTGQLLKPGNHQVIDLPGDGIFAGSVVFQRTGDSAGGDWFRLRSFQAFDQDGKDVGATSNGGSCTSSYKVNDYWP